MLLDGGDGASLGSIKLVLHLHSLDDGASLTSFDVITNLDLEVDEGTSHRRGEDLGSIDLLLGDHVLGELGGTLGADSDIEDATAVLELVALSSGVEVLDLGVLAVDGGSDDGNVLHHVGVLDLDVLAVNVEANISTLILGLDDEVLVVEGEDEVGVELRLVGAEGLVVGEGLDLLVSVSADGGGDELLGLGLIEGNTLPTIGPLVLNEGGGNSGLSESLGADDGLEEGRVVVETTDDVGVEGVVHTLDGNVTGLTPGDELADHRIVVHGDLRALENTRIATDTLAGRLDVLGELTEGRKEVTEGILGVDTALDGVTVLLEGPVLESVGELAAGGDPEHLLDEILTGDHFGDRVLDLETGVHLEEVEVLVLIAEHLDGTGGVVVDSLGHHAGLLAHSGTGGFIDEAGRRLLDDLLVTTLDGALSLGEGAVVAVLIGKDLNLDVAGLLDELLDEHTVITEGGEGLLLGEVEAGESLLVVVGDTHTLTTTTGGGLDHDGIADLIGDLDDLLVAVDDAVVAGNGVDLGFDGHDLGLDLVTHGLDGELAGTAPLDALGLKSLGHLPVLGEEAVAGMDGVGAGLLAGLDDLVDSQVGILGGGGSDADSLVGHLDVLGEAVGLGVDCNSLYTHTFSSLEDTAGDFTTVGDEDLVEGADYAMELAARCEHTLGGESADEARSL